MAPHFITTSDHVLFDAVDAVLACIPRPWTRRMIGDAVNGVLFVADEWRGMTEPREVDDEDVLSAYLHRRLGFDRYAADFADVVVA